MAQAQERRTDRRAKADPWETEQVQKELARKYIETRDKKITEELYELARELEKMEKESVD